MSTTLLHKSVRLKNELRFEVDGEHYIYQGLSGVIIKLDEVTSKVLDVLKSREAKSPEQIAQELEGLFPKAEVYSAVQELVDMEVLVDEEGLRQNSLTPPVPLAEHLPVQTLVFHLINECNLGCTYCYAGGGDYGAPMKTMDEATAKQAIDFLLRESGASRKVSVVLFGGEPLLNWSLIKTIVEYGEEQASRAGKEIEFSLTTNGTLLNEARINFLAEHRVGVTVSMDGPEEVHNIWRPFKNGAGSYHLVRRNVEKLIARHKTRPVATRVTLTKDFPNIKETMTHLLDELGFHEVGFAPVSTSDEDLLMGNPELFRLLDEFSECAEEFVQKALRNEFLGFSNLINILVELHVGVNKGYGCGAGLGFLAVSPSGDLFLCHRFNEDEQYRLGDIHTGINRTFQQELLNSLHVDKKTTCTSCALKHTCSGGCYFEAKERMGEITSPNLHYCRWMKAWYTLGLKTYVRIMKENPAFLDRLVGEGSNCQSN